MNECISIIVRRSGTQHKDRGLKTLRDECQVTHKGKAIRETAGALNRTLQAVKAWPDVCQAMKPKQKDCRARLLYPAGLSSKMEGQIKTFPEKHKPKLFVTRMPVGQKALQGQLHRLGSSENNDCPWGTDKQMRSRQERVLTHPSCESLKGTGWAVSAASY